MVDKEDLNLVNGLKTNDPHYQHLLVDMYAGRLLHIVQSLGLSREDSLEVVNDSLYKAVKRIDSFDLNKSKKFHAWIFRIAINTAKDRLRQIKEIFICQSTEERTARGLQNTEAVWQDTRQTDSEVGYLSKRIMLQALSSLSENDKDILRLFACGFKHKEIASMISKTPGAVKTGHFRAKERLRLKYLNILESVETTREKDEIKNFLGIELANEKT